MPRPARPGLARLLRLVGAVVSRRSRRPITTDADRWTALLHHARAGARLHGWRWYVIVDAADMHRYATCRGVFDIRDLPGASPLEMSSKHGLPRAREQGKRLFARYRVRGYVSWLRDLAREAEGQAA